MLLDLIGNELKLGFDKIVALKKTPGHTQDELNEVYKTDILPYLIQLRRQNRKEKDDLYDKASKIKELYEQLTDLEETCDSLSFMVSCLKTQADIQNVQPKQRNTATHMENVSNNHISEELFDLDSVIKLDHVTRMKILDEEERKRKELQDRLSEINAETKIFELKYSQATGQMNDVKPHIKQLLEKVGPTLQQVGETNDTDKKD